MMMVMRRNERHFGDDDLEVAGVAAAAADGVDHDDVDDGVDRDNDDDVFSSTRTPP